MMKILETLWSKYKRFIIVEKRKEFKPELDYGALSGTELINLWKHLSCHNPQRFFVYSEIRKRNIQLPPCTKIEKLRYKLDQNEVFLFEAPGLWPYFHNLNPVLRLLSLNSYILLPFLVAVYVSFILDYYVHSNYLYWLILPPVILYFLVFALPTTHITIFVTNKKIGRYYSVLKLIHLCKIFINLTNSTVLVHKLFIDHSWISYLGFKSSDPVFGGLISVVKQQINSMTFAMDDKWGKPLLYLVIQAINDLGSEAFISQVSVMKSKLNSKTLKIKTVDDCSFGQLNDLCSYYQAMAASEWFHQHGQKNDRYRPLAELCYYFARNKVVLPSIDPEKNDIERLLDSDESFILKASLKRLLFHKYAIFTTRHLLITDRKFKLHSSYCFDALSIHFNLEEILIYHCNKKIGAIKRDWCLVPDVETLSLVTGTKLTHE